MFLLHKFHASVSSSTSSTTASSFIDNTGTDSGSSQPPLQSSMAARSCNTQTDSNQIEDVSQGKIVKAYTM